jgi:hypothetical protein
MRTFCFCFVKRRTLYRTSYFPPKIISINRHQPFRSSFFFPPHEKKRNLIRLARPLLSKDTPILLHTNAIQLAHPPLRIIITNTIQLNLHIILPPRIPLHHLKLIILLILNPRNTRKRRKHASSRPPLTGPRRLGRTTLVIHRQHTVQAGTLHTRRPGAITREKAAHTQHAEYRFETRQTRTRKTDINLDNRPDDDFAEIVRSVALCGEGDLQKDYQPHERYNGDEGAEGEHAAEDEALPEGGMQPYHVGNGHHDDDEVEEDVGD